MAPILARLEGSRGSCGLAAAASANGDALTPPTPQVGVAVPVYLTNEPITHDIDLNWQPSSTVAWVRLRNACTETLVFKVLTNAPRRWTVRPNSLAIRPGVSVDVSLSIAAGAAGEDASEDRHLILYVPVTAEEAARVAEARRTKRPREGAPIERLQQGNDGVGHVRITLGGGCATPSSAATSRAAPFTHQMSTPRAPPDDPPSPPQQQPPPPPPTEAAVPDGPNGQVAARVALLQRFPRGSNAAVADRKGRPVQKPQMPSAGAPPPGPLPARALPGLPPAPDHPPPAPPFAASRSADADAPLAPAEPSTRQPADGVLAALHRLVQLLASVLLDEVSPWLKWKIYDVLFALALARLSRHFRAARWLRDVCDAA